mgnify:FL=1|jgi:hypothetical protein|tara:strand:+ start:10384 stop:12570 length:2187 start_codon:yes stop_codon:yes gene_type:complete
MLQKLGFAPGFNKQVTETGAEGQWFDGDNVRFRYGTPEKIGGWSQLGQDKLTGAGRALHHWDNNAGIKYAAIGTNKILYVYSGGTYYDIHPIRTTLTGAKFTSSSSSTTVTVVCTGAHGLLEDDIVLFDSVTGVPAGSTYSNATFEDIKYMVSSVPTATTFTITMAAQETGTPLTTSDGNSTSVLCYYNVGPSQQLGGFGWGTALWGGTANGPATSTLSTTLPDDATTTVVLANTSAFPASGEIRIGSEDISFTNNDTGTGTLSGGARAVNGTTRAAHTAGATVTNISDYVAWGEASSSDFTIDPGLWILDNYGTKLIALIYNGACFEWDASPSNATSIRATLLPNAPTASRHVLVSTPDRHLVFFGTETTVGSSSTQDDMFIRFSSQESIDQTDSYTVKANNTAGTQRLADGSRIMGAIKGRDAIYVWTDTALFLMKFVGQPFTFSFEQVGTNCGLIGKNACIEVDGAAYWMSENGFFTYDGQLKSIPCLVEDYVYDDINFTSRDLINVGLNNLFGEVTWFYCTSGSNVVNRMVTYNYLDSSPKRPIWTTGSLARAAWQDSAVFDKPHATYYNPDSNTSYDVIGNTDGCTIYYQQETGTDQVDAGGVTTAILGSITSGDFDITQRRSNTGQTVGMPDLRGDGEFIMRISRFIPDFITQTGSTRVSFVTRTYPNSSSTTSNFDITSSTTKKDTRLRARSIALKVSNTAASQDWKLGTFRLDIHPGGRR